MPLFNEAAGLSALHARLSEVARQLKEKRGLTCEVVYVDDGSRDATLSIARELPASQLDVQVVSLSRNFGKEAALLAGLEHARLGAVLFIDGDGQHPPDLSTRWCGHWLEDGYDVVYTAKATSRERAFHAPSRRCMPFTKSINWGARQKIPEDAGDFRLLSPRAAAALRQMPERNRFFKGLASWIGFRQMRVDYDPAGTRARQIQLEHARAGRPFDRRADLLLGRAAAARQPARAPARRRRFHLRHADPGRDRVLRAVGARAIPRVIVGLMVLGGVQLIMIGVMGEYIAKVLSEIKARPVYFVAEHSLKQAGRSALANDCAAQGPPPNDAARCRADPAAASYLAMRR